MTAKKLARIPLHLTRALAAILIAALVVVVGGSVILRIFGIVPSGSTELATLLFIWAIYIGVFLALLEGGHLAMTVATNRLHGRSMTAVLILSDALVLLFAIVVATEGYRYVQLALNSVRLTPSLGISPAWQYSALFVGITLCAVYLVINIGRNIMHFVRDEEPRTLDEEDLAETSGS